MNGDERRLEHADAEKLFEQIRDCTKLMGSLASDEHRRLHLENHQSPIGRGQALVLRILSQDDGLPQMMLAEKLDIRPSSLGELVSKLETNGFVERRKNQADKRVYNVFLTVKGREITENFVNPW
ncbi:MAG TPA: hypothetical protein DEP42_07575 [Ruminococcaceae bacterium]|nr:hypothetical protein [Oscillospiraceae bacterium]